MSTADRIIDASVKLFNTAGITQVSLRGIAEEIGISHGNLAYHFSNKDEILAAIYTRMEQEMDDAVYPAGDLTLHHYHRMVTRISEFHDRYRFFYLDMMEIARRYPRVIRRYRKTVALRFEQYDRLMLDLVGKRLVKREPEPGYYRSRFRSIWVMSTFWLQHKAVLGDKHPVLDAGSDVRHVWEIVLPHLTAKGLREFRDICESEQGPSGHCPVTPLYTALYLEKAS
jgi:AcrR family transcriptional regulator